MTTADTDEIKYDSLKPSGIERNNDVGDTKGRSCPVRTTGDRLRHDSVLITHFNESGSRY